ncbi:hypothetical protein FQZ97_973550 [compost metagenome]
MAAVSQRLATRFVVAPGAGQNLALEVQGANLARYAELSRLLEPFGARLTRVEGDRLEFQVNASPEQLRAQLGLAGLQESAPEAPAAPAASTDPQAAPAPASLVVPRNNLLRFHW